MTVFHMSFEFAQYYEPLVTETTYFVNLEICDHKSICSLCASGLDLTCTIVSSQSCIWIDRFRITTRMRTRPQLSAALGTARITAAVVVFAIVIFVVTIAVIIAVVLTVAVHFNVGA
jgi:hypothetical protein